MTTALKNQINNALIFKALLKRDLKVVHATFIETMIDNSFILAADILLYRCLMPLLGLPLETIVPLYIGSIIMTMLEIGYTMSTSILLDINGDKFIDFQQTLPISKNWLIAEYIVAFMVKAAVITLPLLTIGILLLGHTDVFFGIYWPTFIIIYLLAMAFFAALFLTFSVRYSIDWYFTNLWARRIDFLFGFGCVFFTWKRVYAFSPAFSYFMLLNPLTYAVEGLRSAMIGNEEFIPAWICAIALLFWTSVMIFVLKKSLQSKLDYI